MFRGVIVLAIATAPLLLLAGEAPYRPKIPKVWVESELDQLDVPVSVPAYSQKIISPDYYYRIPVAPIRIVRPPLDVGWFPGLTYRRMV